MSINALSSNVITRPEANVGISQAGRVRSEIQESRSKPLPKEKVEVKHVEVKHPEDRDMSQEDVIKTIEKANKEFVTYDRRFEFSIHEKTRQIMVKVIDANNDEVIRELPPEKVLDMVAALWEVAGILIDRKI